MTMRIEPTRGPYRIAGGGGYFIESPTSRVQVGRLDLPTPIAKIIDHRHVADEVKQANARLLAASWELRGVLARLIDSDPFYDDPDDGPFCRFCFVNSRSKPHTADCEWVESRALLARIDGHQPATLEIEPVADGIPRLVAALSPTLWAAYAGSAQGSEITVHPDRLSALRAVYDTLVGDGTDDLDDDQLEELIKEHCSHSADDFEVQEVHLP